MSLNAVTHLNFRGQAREALDFYRSVFGGDLTIVTYQDLQNVQHPADANHVVWGQVCADNGFCIMAYDVQTNDSFDRGDRSFYVSLRGQTTAEVETCWAGLSRDATVLQPLGPAQWAPLYGMLTDRSGITWVVDVAAEYAA